MERNVRRQYGRSPLDYKYWNIKFQNAGGIEDLQRPGELVQRKLLRLWDHILNKALANEFLPKLRWFSKVKYKLMYTRKIKTVHALEPADFSCRALFYFVKCYRPKLIGIRTSEGFRKFSELKQWWSGLVKTHLDFSDSHFDWFFLQCVAVAIWWPANGPKLL